MVVIVGSCLGLEARVGAEALSHRAPEGPPFPGTSSRWLLCSTSSLLYAACAERDVSCFSTSTPAAQTKPASLRATAVTICCLTLPRLGSRA